MQGIYTYASETHTVSRKHSVAAILLLLFIVHIIIIIIIIIIKDIPCQAPPFTVQTRVSITGQSMWE
jgi:hypothetical protein